MSKKWDHVKKKKIYIYIYIYIYISSMCPKTMGVEYSYIEYMRDLI